MKQWYFISGRIYLEHLGLTTAPLYEMPWKFGSHLHHQQISAWSEKQAKKAYKVHVVKELNLNPTQVKFVFDKVEKLSIKNDENLFKFKAKVDNAPYFKIMGE